MVQRQNSWWKGTLDQGGIPVVTVLPSKNPQLNGGSQQFLYIFTLGKCFSMLSYRTAHLIKGKHIYHLITACFMAT